MKLWILAIFRTDLEKVADVHRWCPVSQALLSRIFWVLTLLFRRKNGQPRVQETWKGGSDFNGACNDLKAARKSQLPTRHTKHESGICLLPEIRSTLDEKKDPPQQEGTVDRLTRLKGGIAKVSAALSSCDSFRRSESLRHMPKNQESE